MAPEWPRPHGPHWKRLEEIGDAVLCGIIWYVVRKYITLFVIFFFSGHWNPQLLDNIGIGFDAITNGGHLDEDHNRLCKTYLLCYLDQFGYPYSWTCQQRCH